jgi:hypothetical protein
MNLQVPSKCSSCGIVALIWSNDREAGCACGGRWRRPTHEEEVLGGIYVSSFCLFCNKEVPATLVRECCEAGKQEDLALYPSYAQSTSGAH